MILNDVQITNEMEWGNLKIESFRPKHLQPASVDVCLDNNFRLFPHRTEDGYREIDPTKDEDFTSAVHVEDGRYIQIFPRQLVLAATFEWFRIPTNVVARIEGKSSLGRLGLVVHATAGFIDPGFEGQITLEVTNFNNVPIRLYPGYNGMTVAQISFHYMHGHAANPYGSGVVGSKYQGQVGPTPSQYWRNYR